MKPLRCSETDSTACDPWNDISMEVRAISWSKSATKQFKITQFKITSWFINLCHNKTGIPTFLQTFDGYTSIHGHCAFYIKNEDQFHCHLVEYSSGKKTHRFGSPLSQIWDSRKFRDNELSLLKNIKKVYIVTPNSRLNSFTVAYLHQAQLQPGQLLQQSKTKRQSSNELS